MRSEIVQEQEKRGSLSELFFTNDLSLIKVLLLYETTDATEILIQLHFTVK